MKQFQNEANPVVTTEYDAGWLQALGYIRNWIHAMHPKPNTAIQKIISEINEMESGQWLNNDQQ